MTWKLGGESSPSPKSRSFPSIPPFCPRWPMRECGNAHTGLWTGIGKCICQLGAIYLFISSSSWMWKVFFGHIPLPAPVCLCWAHALGGWDWWQLFVFTFLILTQQHRRCWRCSDSAQNSLGRRNSAYFQVGFFSLSLIYFFHFVIQDAFLAPPGLVGSSQISPAVVIFAGFTERTQHCC